MNILLKPIVTEKMTSQGDKFNRYGFLVAKDANKIEIKKAVEELYEVKVAKITMLITPQGQKKAFVKLTPEYKASDVAIKLGIL